MFVVKLGVPGAGMAFPELEEAMKNWSEKDRERGGRERNKGEAKV